MNIPIEIQKVVDRFKAEGLSQMEKNLLIDCPSEDDAMALAAAIPQHYGKTPCWVNGRPSVLVFDVVEKSTPMALLSKKDLPDF